VQCLENAIPWRKISPVRKAGQIICIERSRLRFSLGVPELIFVGLFHFVPIEVLRSSNSRQIVPAQLPPRFFFLFLILFSFQPLEMPHTRRFLHIISGESVPPSRYSHSRSHPIYSSCGAIGRGIISKNICGIDVTRIIAKRMALGCRRPTALTYRGESIYIVHYVYSRVRRIWAAGDIRGTWTTFIARYFFSSFRMSGCVGGWSFINVLLDISLIRELFRCSTIKRFPLQSRLYNFQRYVRLIYFHMKTTFDYCAIFYSHKHSMKSCIKFV